MTWTLSAALVCMGLCAARPQSALASYRGRNGLIAFATAKWVYVVNPDGSRPHRILPTPISLPGGLTIKVAARASWSPNGSRVVFDDAQGLNSIIYRMRTDGSSVVPLEMGYDASLGPNGALTFVRSVSQVLHIFAKQKGQAALDLGQGEDPEWSPTGDRIGFRCDDDICVMNPDGLNRVCVTCAAGQFGGFPSWAPGGGRIAFQYDDDLFVIRVDGSGLQRLTNIPQGSGVAINPAWSPNGRWIAYSSTDQFARTSVKKIRLSDGKRVVVTYAGTAFPA